MGRRCRTSPCSSFDTILGDKLPFSTIPLVVTLIQTIGVCCVSDSTPLITSDCGPEKIRPKKIILRVRKCRFSTFFQLLLRKNCAAQLQPKTRRWTLVLSIMSSFVGQ